jgi:hypothetical protein
MRDKETAATGKPIAPQGQSIIVNLLQTIQDMEENGETKRDISGEAIGPFFSKADYNCTIRIGLEQEKIRYFCIH